MQRFRQIFDRHRSWEPVKELGHQLNDLVHRLANERGSSILAELLFREEIVQFKAQLNDQVLHVGPEYLWARMIHHTGKDQGNVEHEPLIVD